MCARKIRALFLLCQCLTYSQNRKWLRTSQKLNERLAHNIKDQSYAFLLLSGSSDNLIPAAKLKQPSIATIPQTYRVPVGGDAELECKLLNIGDSVQLWKNGTRVISVGSLQVNPFSLLPSFLNLLPG